MKLYLIGGGGFALEVLETVLEAHPDLEIAGVFDDDTRVRQENSTGAPYLGTSEDFVNETPPDALYAIAIGDNVVRMKLDQRYSAEGKQAFSVIHPTACVSTQASIGDGAYIAAFAFVGPRSQIGRHCIVNVGASIGHHAVLEDFVQVCPGARVSGFARIKRGAFLASNSVVPPNGVVGEGAKVAANSFVARPVPAGQLVVGVPAKSL